MKKLTLFIQAMLAVLIMQAQTKNDPQKLTDPASGFHEFGYSVAVSGDYLIVGAPNENSDYGSAYIYHNDGATWSLYQTLLPTPGGEFGTSVDIKGDYAIVGAPSENGVSNQDGVIYVYHNDNGTWNFQTKLYALDTADWIGLGSSIALDSDFILATVDIEYAYFYHFDGTNWLPYQKVNSLELFGSPNFFSGSLDIEGDYAIIGSAVPPMTKPFTPSLAYILHNIGGVWSKDTILTSVYNTEPEDHNVTMGNNMVFVTSPISDTTDGILVFENNGGTWIEQTSLAPLSNDTYFELDFANNSLIAGSAFDNDMGDESGAAFLFSYSNGSWSEVSKFYDISKSYEHFGQSVSIDNSNIIVGAPNVSSATVFPIDYFFSGYVWTGAAGNGDWNDPANWNPAGVPGINDDVSIPQNTDTVFYTSGDITVRNLEIQYGGSFVLSGGSITLSQDLSVYGSFSMITDPATNIPPRLIVNGNISGAGDFYFNYYIPENDDDWHAISTPLQVNTNSGFINDFYLNIWDETQNSFIHIEPVECNLPDFNFTAGLGAFIKLDPDYATTNNCAVQNPPTIDYSTGEPQYIEIHEQTHLVHNNNFTYPLTYTAGGSYEGWNLTGNPYTATIDITSLSWDAGVDQSIQIWDGSNYISGTASGVGNYLVAPGQGFFVHTGNNANFNFSTTALTTSSMPLYKSQNPLLKLRASSSQYEDVTYLCIDDIATQNFDKKCDAPKMFTPVEEVPQLYTVSSDGKKLSINSVNQLGETMPLFFRAGVNGEFSIEAVKVSGFSTVILEDLFTGAKTDLLKDDYTFYYSTEQPDDRFVLHFTPLGLEQNDPAGINVFSYGDNIIINIDNNRVSTVFVYDLMGKEIIKAEAQQGRNVFKINDKGLFIVSVVLDNGIVNRKVFIK